MDLLQRLKTETRPHHDRIEGAIGPMRPGLTADEYVDLLRRFYGFYAAWEPAVAATLGGRLPHLVADRRRTPWLERDLAHFGLTAADLAVVPRCDRLPRVDTVARALGSTYVVEGSTLGGQYISRHLGKSLGLTPDAGLAFYAGYGERTGAMWQAFREVLVEHASGDPDDAVAAAAETFDALNAWMSAGVAA